MLSLAQNFALYVLINITSNHKCPEADFVKTLEMPVKLILKFIRAHAATQTNNSN